MSNIPNKVLSADVMALVPLEKWAYDDGTGDPYWDGGSTPRPYRWELTMTIAEQVHGSHLTRRAYRYDGFDVNVGDWVASTGTGIALKVTEIVSKTQTTVVANVEDVDRYNTFSDQFGNGIFTVPGGAVIFQLSEGNMPIVDPLPATVNQVTFTPQVEARFANNPPMYSYRFEQVSNGFSIGDNLWINPVTNLFEVAKDGAGLKSSIGVIVSIIGEDAFYIAPVTKILENIVPILPGAIGDKIYVDGSGNLTTTPNVDNKASYIQVSDADSDEIVGTISSASTTASNVMSINGVNVTFTTGTLAQSIIDINAELVSTDVEASEVAAPTNAITVIGDTQYGVVGMTGNTASATINGTSVTFDITVHGTATFGSTASDEVDMAESINLANIPNLYANSASGLLTITHELGDAITIVNGATGANGEVFAGASSGSGIALSTAASTSSFLKLTNAKGYGITLVNVVGDVLADFGLTSVHNGKIPYGLVLVSGESSGGGDLVRYVVENTGGEEVEVLASGSIGDVTYSRALNVCSFVIANGAKLISTRIRVPGSVPVLAQLIVNVGTGDMNNTDYLDRWAPQATVNREDTGNLVPITLTLDGTNAEQFFVNNLPADATSQVRLVF